MISKEDYRTQRIENALEFLLSRYDSEEALNVLSNFGYQDIHWSATCGFPKMRGNGFKMWKNGRTYNRGNRDKPIRIQLNRNYWSTYERKTVGVQADIKCTESQCIEFQLVHEITHMIQRAEGRQLSEVETTQNEIDYAEKAYPSLHRELIPVE